MLVPKKYAWDDFFDFNFFNNDNRIMRTDIKENDDNYSLSIDLPGYKKEDIHIDLVNGYLNIKAVKEEVKCNEKMVCNERYKGECQRSFYLGENIKEEEVKAQYENGVLYLIVPKNKQQLSTKRTIDID